MSLGMNLLFFLLFKMDEAHSRGHRYLSKSRPLSKGTAILVEASVFAQLPTRQRAGYKVNEGLVTKTLWLLPLLLQIRWSFSLFQSHLQSNVVKCMVRKQRRGKKMRIVTYNVNGLRPRVSQFGSLLKFLNSLQADIICIQVPLFLPYFLSLFIFNGWRILIILLLDCLYWILPIL